MKNNKVLVWVVIVLAVALAGVVVWQVVGGDAPLYAVSLKTGELYFGKLVRVPYFGLQQVYLLQSTGDAENPLSVQRFANVFWGPEDEIKISRDNVSWMTRLTDESQLARVIRANPDLLAGPQAPAVEE